MGEFNDYDFTEDQHEDSDLVRQLRKQLRDKDKELRTVRDEVETFRTQTVESAIREALKGVPDDRRAKVEKLIRKDAKTTDDVQTWLDEYADVFDIRAGVDVSGAAAESGGNAPQGDGNGQGVDEDTRAQFEAAQRTETGGKAIPQIGVEKGRQDLKDVEASASSYDARIQKLRELGYIN